MAARCNCAGYRISAPHFGEISMFCALRNLTNCAILITNQMNMPLSRATEGTGPLMSGNLHFLQGANSCGMAMPKDEDCEPLIFC